MTSFLSPITLELPKEQRPFSGNTVLMYYDGPLLFTIPFVDKVFVFSALPEEIGTWPFLVAGVKAERYQEFYNLNLTVEDTFKESPLYLVKDYGAESIILEPMNGVPADWIPGDIKWRDTVQ